jgi:hypothetical protein
MNFSLCQSRIISVNCILMIGSNIMQITSWCKHLLSQDFIIFLIVSIDGILLFNIKIELDWLTFMHIRFMLQNIFY